MQIYVGYGEVFVVELIGSDWRLLSVVFVGGDDEREEEERESDGLEERLSPNAVVLTVLVVVASIGLVVVEVFEESGYGLTYDDEDD